MKKEIKPIDKVTTRVLDVALRMCDINLNTELIDKIIDLVELIEKRGDKVSIKDVIELQNEWRLHDSQPKRLKNGIIW